MKQIPTINAHLLILNSTTHPNSFLIQLHKEQNLVTSVNKIQWNIFGIFIQC